MTYYLKYRPQKIEDLDIESVRLSLSKLVESGQIPHALLLAGTKGTGKTSAARILAKIINCEDKSKDKPCNKCDSCVSITDGTNIDVVEMDAASNRGIDDIRVLREGVKLAPIVARAKVYIIDEAHMLTPEASNALLKTLEEPPAHVYFMLATTNPEKLIDTIRSRTTLIKFTKATKEEVLRSLKRIVEEEKLKISGADLGKIYEMSRGSFRDAVKLLENFSIEGKFADTDGISPEKVLSAIENKDKKAILSKSSTLSIETLLSILHKELLADSGVGEKMSKIGKTDLIRLVELLLTASEQSKYSPIDELPIELAFIKYFGEDIKNEQGSKLDDGDIKLEKNVAKKKNEETEAPPVVEIHASTSQNANQTTNFSDQDSISSSDWDKVLKAVRPVNASIEALLRASKPLGFDGKSLRLGVYYKFHKERLDDVRNKKLLEDVIATIFNNPIRVDCSLTEMPPEAVKKVELVEPAAATKEPDIAAVAQEIFS